MYFVYVSFQYGSMKGDRGLSNDSNTFFKMSNCASLYVSIFFSVNNLARRITSNKGSTYLIALASSREKEREGRVLMRQM